MEALVDDIKPMLPEEKIGIGAFLIAMLLTGYGMIGLLSAVFSTVISNIIFEHYRKKKHASK